MAQFGRPIADTTIGTYTDEAAGTTNIYTGIDETVAEDTEYVKSVSAPSSAVYVTALTSSLEDPVSSSGHVQRVRYRKSAAGGAQINLTVELRQAYVAEGTQGTLIATHAYTDIAETWVTGSETLTSGEADAITDYTDLALRYVFTQV